MELNSQSMGQGPDLFILHGLFGSGENWLSLAKRFADSFTVHIIDLRNHGRSKHCDLMTYGLMALDIKEYADAKEIKSFSLIGHSMGGKTAMQVASSYPNYVNKLVVVDIAPKVYPDHHQDLIEAMVALEIVDASSRKELDERLAESISSVQIRQFLLKNVYRTEDKLFVWSLNLVGIKANYRHIMQSISLGSINKPVLFIVAEQSNYINVDDESSIKKHFTQVQFIRMNTSHWVHAESPYEFYDHVFAFLIKQ